MRTIKRVLLTGGTGFVGWWMLNTAPDVQQTYLNRTLYDTEPWEKGDWEYIVHLAPISPARVLKYAQKHDTRVLFASSGAVYGQRTEYAHNKFMWEQECTLSGADVVIARLFTFVGKHLKNNYAITSFIENALNGKPIQVWGDGSTVRSYLYGEDLGRWLWKLMLDGNSIYDVGSVLPYTILQVAQMVAGIIPTKIEFVNKNSPNPYYLPDTTRAKTELGLKETIGLKDAIERTIKE